MIWELSQPRVTASSCPSMTRMVSHMMGSRAVVPDAHGTLAMVGRVKPSSSDGTKRTNGTTNQRVEVRLGRTLADD